MTVSVSNTSLADSFNTWRLNTNYIATVMGNNVVTVNPHGVANRGGNATGNGMVEGTFAATVLRTPTLQGGNTSYRGNLFIATNTIIGVTGDSNPARTFNVYANTTFHANVIFNTVGSDRVNLGDIDRVILGGGEAGQFIRTEAATDNPQYKFLELSDIKNLSTNSAHIILSGANSEFSDNGDTTHLIFGSDTDRIHMYLAKDVTPGDSDLFVNLADIAGDSRFVIADSANTVVAHIDSDGNVDITGTLNVDGSTTLNGVTATTIQANNTLDVLKLASLDGGIDVGGAFTVAETTGNIDTIGTLDVDGLASLDGGIDVSGAFTVAHTSGNIDTAGTLNVGGATTLNGDVTLGDASTDTITVEGNFANQSTTGLAQFNGDVDIGDANTDTLTITSEIDSDVIPNANGMYNLGAIYLQWNQLWVNQANVVNDANVGGNLYVGQNLTVDGDTRIWGKLYFGNVPQDLLTVNATSSFTSNTTIGSSSTDDILIVNARLASDLIANTSGADDSAEYDLGSKEHTWSVVYANTVYFANTIIDSNKDVLFGKNGTLHANNTINNETIKNTMLVNDGITISSNNETTSEVQLGDTLSIVSGNGTGVTVNFTSATTDPVSPDTVTISGVDATDVIKGVASFDSGDFSVDSGAVSLADSLTGAVLSISGTDNEVEVSRTNGTVTVGLPDDVIIAGDLTVNGTTIISSGQAFEADDGTFATLTVTDDATITGQLNVGQNIVVAGNLIVSGTTTTINTETIDLADNIIKLNSNLAGDTAPTENAGIEINRGSSENAELIWNETAGRWQVFYGENSTFDNILSANAHSITDRDAVTSFSGADDFLLVYDASAEKIVKGTIQNVALQGVQGIQGIQGVQGTQGIQGVQGTQGIQGPQGTQGIQGPQGTQGIQGPQGTQGIQGVQGTQGIQGPQGPQGIQGVQGTQGIQGPQGTQGIQGVQGIQGIQGVQGTQGIQGPQGPQGIQGPQGPQGPQGIQGVQGTKGIQGIQGTQGIQGISGALFLTATNTATKTAGALTFNDNIEKYYGTGNDYSFYFNGSNMYVDSVSTTTDLYFRSNSTNRFTFDMGTGDFIATGDVISLSDARVKENIIDVDNALEKVINIRGVYFNKVNSENNRRHVGVVAQEIEKILPEVVTEDAEGMKNVAYGNVVGVLIEAIKELKAEIEDLKNKE